MPVLGTGLAGEKHHFLCAHALGVDIGDQLKADVFHAVQAEIGDLDVCLFGIRQDDACLFIISDGFLLTGKDFAFFHFICFSPIRLFSF